MEKIEEFFKELFKEIPLKPIIILLIYIVSTFLPNSVVNLQKNGFLLDGLNNDQNLTLIIFGCYFASVCFITLSLGLCIPFIKPMNFALGVNFSIDNCQRLVTQNLTFSVLILFIIGIGQLISFLLQNTIWAFIFPFMCITLLGIIKKLGYANDFFSKIKQNVYWNKIAQLQFASYLFFFIIYYFVATSITLSPSIHWERDYYTFKQGVEIIKIKGLHNLKDAKLKRIAYSKEIPVRHYQTESDTYMIIDFTMDIPAEGEYLFSTIFDGKNVEHKLVYIYNGSLEYKEQCINNLIKQIVKNEGDNIDASIQKQLEEFKRNYLAENAKELKLSGENLKEKLSQKSVNLLSETIL
jgi:hypothetical protein